MIKKQDILTLKIESLAYGGKGIARHENFVIFVRDALPEQTVTAKIVRLKKSFAEAIVLEVLEHCKDEVEAPCPYFRDCGGCTIQNLSYEKQCEIKTKQVRETFSHLVKMNDIPILDALPAPDIFGYRNKMDFSAGDKRWVYRENDTGANEDFAIGLHAPNCFSKILDMDHCLLQGEEQNRILKTIREWAQVNEITLNNPVKHVGYLRSIIIRKGIHTGEIMVNIVTRTEDKDKLKPLCKMLKERHPAVTSCVNNITNAMGYISRGDREILLYGESVIHDCIGDLKYEIAANAFFQTNTTGAELLYNTIVDFTDTQPDKVVWDLYCGTGSIAMYLARSVKKVYGFELVEDAVNNARKNAERNKIENCEFFQADLDKFMQSNQKLIQSLDKPDIAIVDPPRCGLNPRFLEQLLVLRPKEIVYVSCNPSTQARDLEILAEFYNILKIQPVDMFPHTHHIETVAKCVLKS